MLTDASKGSKIDNVSGVIEWALVQKGDKEDDWRPISFGSRVLTKTEMNYPINQLEQLAVIEGYRDKYFFTLGHPTTIFCDNKPSVANATQLEIRMLGIIQGLVNDTSCKVSYREGKENQVADYLS